MMEAETQKLPRIDLNDERLMTVEMKSLRSLLRIEELLTQGNELLQEIYDNTRPAGTSPKAKRKKA